jgi:hypothetical protein
VPGLAYAPAVQQRARSLGLRGRAVASRAAYPRVHLPARDTASPRRFGSGQQFADARGLTGGLRVPMVNLLGRRRGGPTRSGFDGDGRVVEGTRLIPGQRATVRGFESLSLRGQHASAASRVATQGSRPAGAGRRGGMGRRSGVTFCATSERTAPLTTLKLTPSPRPCVSRFCLRTSHQSGALLLFLPPWELAQTLPLTVTTLSRAGRDSPRSGARLPPSHGRRGCRTTWP